MVSAPKRLPTRFSLKLLFLHDVEAFQYFQSTSVQCQFNCVHNLAIRPVYIILSVCTDSSLADLQTSGNEVNKAPTITLSVLLSLSASEL